MTWTLTPSRVVLDRDDAHHLKPYEACSERPCGFVSAKCTSHVFTHSTNQRTLLPSCLTR